MKYILVGEVHGTNESSIAFLNIVKREKIKQVALEISSSYQSIVDNNGYSLLFGKKRHDGRLSQAMKNLITELKKLRIKIYCVDPNVIFQRDKKMAENLRKIKGRVAFLCGEVHASTIPFKFGFIKLNTCGYFLPKKDVVNYRIVSRLGGQFYNFKIKTIQGETSSKKTITPSLKNGFDYYYVVDSFSPSR